MVEKICAKCDKTRNIEDYYDCKYSKDKLTYECKFCLRERRKNRWLQIKKENPWSTYFASIQQRCLNPNNSRFHEYGGKGIKFLITEEEIRELWFRDKAYLLKWPSIDRKDNNGNYSFQNCQFIEMKENSIKDRIKPILQYDLEGNFIKEWISISEAGRGLHIPTSSIIQVCQKTMKSTHKFIWKYKESL